MTFSKAEEEPSEESMEELEKKDTRRGYMGEPEQHNEPKHKAEYQCEWPAHGKKAAESHEVHHHGGREREAQHGEEDLSPEPGNPAFWPSAELDQDETWEPPSRNEPDGAPWCELQEDEE